MSRRFFSFTTTLLALSALSAQANVRPPVGVDARFTARERAQGYREHVILAKPKAVHRASIERDEARDGVRLRESFVRLGGLRVLELASTDSADRAIARLQATGHYEFVERDRLRHLGATPNDPALGSQWAISNPTGADIRAPAAWDIITSAPNIVVAVIDSGLNTAHTDITANLWRNPTPLPGANDLNGANFVGGRGQLVNGSPLDENGHGTHVAGIIGAVGNNNLAIAGVAWRVQLMPVKVFSGAGIGAISEIVAGINYAVSRGAHIINASYGENSNSNFSQSELTAIAEARSEGIIFVAASGNDGANLDLAPHYPASYALDNIVTVGASTRTDALASFSNYGGVVDLVAPGEAILSLGHADNTGTATLSGTSMAVPFVSGAVALLKTQFPTDHYRQLLNRLLRGTDPIAAFAGKVQTGGRLNLLRALQSTTNRPFHDDFAERARLSGDVMTVRSSNAGATAEPGEPTHGGIGTTTTLWWEWTPATTRPVRLNTTGSSFDTLLAVYTGNALASLTAVASNDNDAGTTTSRVDFTAQAGVAYQIAVTGKNNSSGLVMLTVNAATANDAFASGHVLTGASDRVTATTANASREPAEPLILGATGGASLWYRWTAPRAGRFQFAAISDDFDPQLAVYTGASLSALTLVSASDNTGVANSQTGSLCTFTAQAGVTYHVTVDTKTPGSTGAFTLTVSDSLWQAVTGTAGIPGAALTGAPAIATDGTLYVGSADRSLYAFAADGSLRWSFATGGTIEHCAPAVAADGTVYIGSTDGFLYALTPTGSVRWTRRFNVGLTVHPANNSPAIGSDGTIYLKAGDGYLYALNPADGTTQWRANVNAPATPASPVIAPDGTVYQGSDDRGLYAFDRAGNQKWRFAADGEIHSTPALDGAGNIYLTVAGSGKFHSLTPAGVSRWTYLGAAGTSGSSPILSPDDGATVYFAGEDKRLHAVRTNDGGARWTYPLGGEVRIGAPAVDSDGTLYLGADDARVYAIAASGALVRTWSTGARIRSSPAIVGHTLYVASGDRKLHALDLGPAQPGGGPWPQVGSSRVDLQACKLEYSIVSPK